MKPLHAWDLSPEEAAQVQKDLRAHLDLTWNDQRPITTVGGVDVALPDDIARCAIVVFPFSSANSLGAQGRGRRAITRIARRCPCSE